MDRSPGSNHGPDRGIVLEGKPLAPRKRSRYPGRNRVMSRQDAGDLAMRDYLADRDGNGDRYKCTDPYVVYGIGLPSAATAMHDYWNYRAAGKIPVEIPTRCRKCDMCLAHRRRLWTARAIDEIAASNRTWFGTLTVNPYERFLYGLDAAMRGERAGHGNWQSLSPENQFPFLAKVIGEDITKWLKRVRKVSGASLRYLLVSEAHKDGFPHFHILLHEPDKAVAKAVLEEQWRAGFSHWRLVKREDPRSAYYACKYLAKDARTRVRGSIRYGRAQLVARSTERMLRVRDAVITPETPRLLEGPLKGRK